MDDEPGILSDVLKIIAEYRANILTIHQSIPINGIASLTLSIQVFADYGRYLPYDRTAGGADQCASCENTGKRIMSERKDKSEENIMINVAVLGYGTVGSGVVEVIEKNKDMVNKKSAQELEVKYILDLRDFPGDPYENKVIHDFNTILQDDSVTIICETMGGVGAAYQFTKQALELGKSVCTSNKELVAKHGPELLQIAREHNCNYLFEASVGGGIPIIRPLNYSLTAEKIEAVNGILNGTTNYILSKMEKEGADFDTVLKEAQDKGYAGAIRKQMWKVMMPAVRSRFCLL